MLGMDEPETLHTILTALEAKSSRVHAMWEGIPADMVEVDKAVRVEHGDQPQLLPRVRPPDDPAAKRPHARSGLKVVNHFCGGLMQMLDLVVDSGADGLETMTPPAMGGELTCAKPHGGWAISSSSSGALTRTPDSNAARPRWRAAWCWTVLRRRKIMPDIFAVLPITFSPATRRICTPSPMRAKNVCTDHHQACADFRADHLGRDRLKLFPLCIPMRPRRRTPGRAPREDFNPHEDRTRELVRCPISS